MLPSMQDPREARVLRRLEEIVYSGVHDPPPWRTVTLVYMHGDHRRVKGGPVMRCSMWNDRDGAAYNPCLSSHTAGSMQRKGVDADRYMTKVYAVGGECVAVLCSHCACAAARAQQEDPHAVSWFTLSYIGDEYDARAAELREGLSTWLQAPSARQHKHEAEHELRWIEFYMGADLVHLPSAEQRVPRQHAELSDSASHLQMVNPEGGDAQEESQDDLQMELQPSDSQSEQGDPREAIAS